MKKISSYYKIIPILLILVFSLSGCVSLQTLRDKQAVWEDASQKSILWQGKRYVYLTNADETYFAPPLNDEIYLNLTESDVPVLLAEYIGEYLDVSQDENFLIFYSDVYCAEEKYGEMKERLKSDIKMDNYACYYYENIEDYTGNMKIFTQKEMNLLEQMDQSKFVEKVYSEEQYFEYEYNEWIADIYLCSDDLLFQKYCGVDLYISGNGEYVWEKYQDDKYYVYVVPQQYNAIIEEVFADAIESYYEMYEEYEDD